MPRKPTEISEYEAQSLHSLANTLDAVNRVPDDADHSSPFIYARISAATIELEADPDRKDGGTFKARNVEGVWLFSRVGQ